MGDKGALTVTIKLPLVIGIALATVLAAGRQTPARAQSEIPVPPPSTLVPLPHHRVGALTGKVRELVGLEVLTAGQGRALTQGLDQTGEALKGGDARGAIRRLATFERHTRALIAGGVLASVVGQPLIDEAARAGAQIGRLAFGAGPARPLSWSVTGCPERQECSYAVLFVDRRATVEGEPDGSAERPFRAIGAALDRADEIEACGVEIRIADGIYAENVVLSRHTTLVGASRDGVLVIGAIVNNAGADLTFRHARVAALDGPGAIFTDAPCATTSISDVIVERSSGFGVYQRGGALTMLGSIVRNTEGVAGSRLAGTAVYLTGGVQASLGLLEIADNAASGIVASGAETRVYATSVAVTRTSVNAFFREEASALGEVAAAVDVRGGALLLMEFSTVSRNELVGLRVRDGSRAHVRYSLIERTLAPPESGTATANAVAMSDGSVLELSQFTLTRGAFIGLWVASAFATASDGEVSWHTIGAEIHGMPAPGDPEYTVDAAAACLNTRVEYVHNDVDLDAGELPRPCLEPDCVPPCRQVPFDCPWCGQ